MWQEGRCKPGEGRWHSSSGGTCRSARHLARQHFLQVTRLLPPANFCASGSSNAGVGRALQPPPPLLQMLLPSCPTPFPASGTYCLKLQAYVPCLQRSLSRALTNACGWVGPFSPWVLPPGAAVGSAGARLSLTSLSRTMVGSSSCSFASLSALLLLCSSVAAASAPRSSRPLRGLQLVPPLNTTTASNNRTTTTTPANGNGTSTTSPAPLYSSAQDALQLRMNNNNSWSTNGTRYQEQQWFLTNRDETRAVCNLTFSVPLSGSGNVSSSYNIDLAQPSARSSSGSSGTLEARAASYASKLQPRAVLTFG